MNPYALVALGRNKQGHKSDRAFALANGLTAQNVVDWKAGRSMPSWENLTKLAQASGFEIWEAVKFMQENSVK